MSWEWTDETVEQLRALKAQPKMTASKIALAMDPSGELLTRNAVIGKMNRIGLGSKRPVKVKANVRVLKPIKPKEAVPMTAVEPPVALLSEPIVTGDKTITDLRSRDCRWPLGELMDPPRFFCGAPALIGKPYCSHHAAQAFVAKASDGSRNGRFQLSTKRKAA